MCTAITFQCSEHYFGRNLDLEYSNNETVTVTPRSFPFPFRCASPLNEHYAMIGVALVCEGYPLYYDATNEHGLSMAGLNFPGNAVYLPAVTGKDNITPFELIPWILGQCADLQQAKKLLSRLNLVDIPFNGQYPLSPLHWFIADSTGSITVEPMADGLHIHENPIGVLTNNPPFDYHMHNLKNYLHLSAKEPVNRFAPQTELKPYSRGMGAMGLPGDLSSASRFVKAAFTKLNSVQPETENEAVSQFFHILGSVAQQEGCVHVGDRFEKTVYSSCCNTRQGIYYYTTYHNSRITAVDMRREDLNGKLPVSYPMEHQCQVFFAN